jgi:hypothetical protein
MTRINSESLSESFTSSPSPKSTAPAPSWARPKLGASSADRRKASRAGPKRCLCVCVCVRARARAFACTGTWASIGWARVARVRAKVRKCMGAWDACAWVRGTRVRACVCTCLRGCKMRTYACVCTCMSVYVFARASVLRVHGACMYICDGRASAVCMHCNGTQNQPGHGVISQIEPRKSGGRRSFYSPAISCLPTHTSATRAEIRGMKVKEE